VWGAWGYGGIKHGGNHPSVTMRTHAPQDGDISAKKVTGGVKII